MKISNETIEILKNFSSINQTFYFRPGSIIRTKHTGNHTFADAKVKEDFPIECGIYEMPKFLSVLSIFNDPDVEFCENYVELSDGKFGVKYFYAAYNIIKEIIPPDKSLKIEKEIDRFVITEEDMSRINKAASFMQLPHLVFTNKTIEVTNIQSKSSNSLVINKDSKDSSVGDDYTVVIKNDNLKLINGGYYVTVGSIKGKQLVQFTHLSGKVNYWVASEKVS